MGCSGALILEYRASGVGDMVSRWQQLKLWVPPWVEDPMSLFLFERGIPGFQVEEGEGVHVLTVYVPERVPVEGLMAQVRAYLSALEKIQGEPLSFDWAVTPVLGEDWREAWKVHFHPKRVTRRFVVKPSWETYDPPEGTVVLQIDPGQAFGTGLHATTRMCLECIDRIMDGPEESIPVAALDLGTGTGILAIALAKMGVREVWAMDIDPLAVEAARTNTRINGVGDQVRVLEGSVDALQGRSFPLVVANLTARALHEMRGTLARGVAPGGRLLLSGILTEEREEVLEAYTEMGLAPAGDMERDMWCALLMVRGV